MADEVAPSPPSYTHLEFEDTEDREEARRIFSLDFAHSLVVLGYLPYTDVIPFAKKIENYIAATGPNLQEIEGGKQ